MFVALQQHALKVGLKLMEDLVHWQKHHSNIILGTHYFHSHTHHAAQPPVTQQVQLQRFNITIQNNYRVLQIHSQQHQYPSVTFLQYQQESMHAISHLVLQQHQRVLVSYKEQQVLGYQQLIPEQAQQPPSLSKLILQL